ncbi:Diaminobutyrate--2-oxoglutarate aminotransferase [compost metagenome]
MKKAIEVVHKHGGLYIADEVQPGFARTGLNFWGYQRHGIQPDIVVMGKPMGNGLPIAGVAVNPELLADFGPKVRYFNTFGGNAVCISAAQAVLDVIRDEGLQQNCHDLGNYLLDGFRSIARNYPAIGDVRGAGLYFAVEFVTDPESKAPDAELTTKVVSGLRDRKVLISTTGVGENSLKIRPLLCFKQAQADQLLETFAETMAAIQR